MKTCSSCGRPDGPGNIIAPGRAQCHSCRKKVMRVGALPAKPREAVEILRAQREAQERAIHSREHAALIAHAAGLEKTVEALGALKSSKPMERIVPAPKKTSKSEVVPLLVLSDWHVEEEVASIKLHGLNEYNLEIAKKRSEICFENASKLIESARTTSKVGRVAIELGGDFFSNSIHLELLETNLLGPGPAAAYAKELLARGIRFWESRFPTLEFDFYCIPGNHGRITEKSRISTVAENSLETFMYQFLASDCASEQVRFHIAPGDELYADIFKNYRVRFIHGDQIGYGGGIGGVSIPLTKWVMRQNQSIVAQLTCLGHFHSAKADRDWMVNGSLIGATPYSKRFGFSPEAPKQQFALIHSSRGRTLVADVWCT